MNLTIYCKKCKTDVPAGASCPFCGGKLAKNNQRVHWVMNHDPARDWMCWNSAARIVLPLIALTAAVLILLEAMSGGGPAVMKLLEGGFAEIMLVLTAIFFLGLWLVLLLQGEESLEGAIDAKGATIVIRLENPSSLQLLTRGKSPALRGQPVEMAHREIKWEDVARIQLWEEKLLLLCYAPSWWMRLAVPMPPEAWPSAIMYLHKTLPKKKDLATVLPELILHPDESWNDVAADMAPPIIPPAELPAPQKPRKKKTPPPEQPALDMAELPTEPEIPSPTPDNPPEEPLPADNAPLPENQISGGVQESMFD